MKKPATSARNAEIRFSGAWLPAIGAKPKWTWTDTKVDYEPITPIEPDIHCLEKDVWKPGNQAGK
jgi:hypothetical protein